jgi:hypothetical protein
MNISNENQKKSITDCVLCCGIMTFEGIRSSDNAPKNRKKLRVLLNELVAEGTLVAANVDDNEYGISSRITSYLIAADFQRKVLSKRNYVNGKLQRCTGSYLKKAKASFAAGRAQLRRFQRKKAVKA